ncbi:hypothetical protein Tco_1526120, partial [Tanacetum coccineum]
PTNVHAGENNDNQAECTNPLCTPVQEAAESSSRNLGNLNVHTSNQPQHSEYRWTKDHPLTQVRGNPSKPVQTRRQLATDPEMCVICKLCSSNMDADTASRLWLQLQQNTIVLRLTVENGIIKLYFVRTEYQLADMFTKALPEDRFKYLVRRIGMRCLTPADLEVLTNETA